MKGILFVVIIAVVYYYGFYEKEPETVDQTTEQEWPKPHSSLDEYSSQYSDNKQDESSQPKKLSKDHVLRGYQDQVQKAKDMEGVVLKAAKKQRKAIDG